MTKHDELQETAIRWLYKNGCGVFAKEVPTKNGIADALGVRKQNSRGDAVYYIEAKSSRADLICRKQKNIYRVAVTECYGPNGIDFYYLILADGVKIEPELYPKFGVIDERGYVVRRAKRFKREGDTSRIVYDLAHALVYRVHGKLYL